jgi:hypothetical protein
VGGPEVKEPPRVWGGGGAGREGVGSQRRGRMDTAPTWEDTRSVCRGLSGQQARPHGMLIAQARSEGFQKRPPPHLPEFAGGGSWYPGIAWKGG